MQASPAYAQVSPDGAQASPAYAQASPGDEWVFGAESPVTVTHPASQQQPEISGNIAVWVDGRPGGGAGNPARIFFKDLTSNDVEAPLVVKPGNGQTTDGQTGPAISGNLVVWLQGYPAKIHYMLLGGGCPGAAGCDQTLNLTGARPVSLAVSGHRIVWGDWRAGQWQADIYMYDIDNPSLGDQPVSTASSTQQSPAIDGDWVVWVDNRGGYFNNGHPTMNGIYARNLATGEERPLTPELQTGIEDSPCISGNRVVWNISSSFNVTTGGIVLYDLSSRQTQTIFDDSGTDSNSDIEGDKIVWVHQPTPSSYEVRLHDLATGISQTVSSGAITPHRPSIFSARIVWQDSRDGDPVIYQNKLGDRAQELAERYRPELHFNHDFTRSDRNDFEPRTVDLMADGAEKLVTSGGDVFLPSLQALVNNPGQENYLDLPGSPANPFDSYIDSYLEQIQNQPRKYDITAYTRVVPKAEGSDNTVIQYWLNYYYNDWYNNHEGDWEMVEVILNENVEPEAVAYSQHGVASKKNWNEAGFSKTGTHPRVFVAEGSHANYFLEGSFLHFLDAATPWGLKDRTGSASWTMPTVDMNGLVGGWADFAGMWGEAQKWWWPRVITESGPKGPAFQGDSWNLPLTWANASKQTGYGNDIILAAHSPVEIHLYDAQGNHVGKNPSGGFDMQIPGSEYFERSEDHSKNIVVHNADVLAGYTVKVEATGTGTMDLELQVPDFSNNVINKCQYLTGAFSPSLKAELNITPAKDYSLEMDPGGDGIFEELRAPDMTESIAADFTPPPAVTDLSVSSVTSGSASLAWTATGDDGSRGTAFRYDLRFSKQPITDANWQYAERTASSLTDPQAAGSAETAMVTGLEAGTTYYFALKARDDSWQESALANIVQTTTTAPGLTWAKKQIYWASWADYDNRQLSVDYIMAHSDTGVVLQSSIQASNCVPDTVYAVTPLPLMMGDLQPGADRTVTLKYHVPLGMDIFITTTYATCKDDAGRTYRFPGPTP